MPVKQKDTYLDVLYMLSNFSLISCLLAVYRRRLDSEHVYHSGVTEGTELVIMVMLPIKLDYCNIPGDWSTAEPKR